MPRFEAFIFKKKLQKIFFGCKNFVVLIWTRTCDPRHECPVPYPLGCPDWYIELGQKKFEINFHARKKQFHKTKHAYLNRYKAMLSAIGIKEKPSPWDLLKLLAHGFSDIPTALHSILVPLYIIHCIAYG